MGATNLHIYISVSDPDSLGPVPVRIQGFAGQNLEKIYSWEKNLIFVIKNFNLPIPRPP
jgi:hypothetical protein